MAIYHLKVTTGSKLKGASGTIRCDYITRQGVYADREEELVLAESGNLPSWARDERHFWEAADTYERRNGRVYNEVEVALPRELSREQQIELAREFVSDLMTPSRLPYTMAIHDRDGHNPHAHVIYSERGDDGVAREMEQHFRRADRAKPWKGGAPKDTSMRGSEWVKQVRKDWEIAANVALERAGESARVDCRSYKERGIARTPQLHLGVAAAAMLRRGVQVDRVASYVRIERIRQLEREIEEELRRARASVREEVDKVGREADEGGEASTLSLSPITKAGESELVSAPEGEARGRSMMPPRLPPRSPAGQGRGAAGRLFPHEVSPDPHRGPTGALKPSMSHGVGGGGAPGSSPGDLDGASERQGLALSVMKSVLDRAPKDVTWKEFADSLKQASVVIVPEGTQGDFGKIRGLYFEHDGVRLPASSVDRGASYGQLSRALGPLEHQNLRCVCDVVVVAGLGDVPVELAEIEPGERLSSEGASLKLPEFIEHEVLTATEMFERQQAARDEDLLTRFSEEDGPGPVDLPSFIEREIISPDALFEAELMERGFHAQSDDGQPRAHHEAVASQSRGATSDEKNGRDGQAQGPPGEKDLKLPAYIDFTPVSADEMFLQELEERLGEEALARALGESPEAKSKERGKAEEVINEIDRVVSARERTADEELIARMGGKDLLAGMGQARPDDDTNRENKLVKGSKELPYSKREVNARVRAVGKPLVDPRSASFVGRVKETFYTKGGDRVALIEGEDRAMMIKARENDPRFVPGNMIASTPSTHGFQVRGVAKGTLENPYTRHEIEARVARITNNKPRRADVSKEPFKGHIKDAFYNERGDKIAVIEGPKQVALIKVDPRDGRIGADALAVTEPTDRGVMLSVHARGEKENPHSRSEVAAMLERQETPRISPETTRMVGQVQRTMHVEGGQRIAIIGNSKEHAVVPLRADQDIKRGYQVESRPDGKGGVEVKSAGYALDQKQVEEKLDRLSKEPAKLTEKPAPMQVKDVFVMRDKGEVAIVADDKRHAVVPTAGLGDRLAVGERVNVSAGAGGKVEVARAPVKTREETPAAPSRGQEARALEAKTEPARDGKPAPSQGAREDGVPRAKGSARGANAMEKDSTPRRPEGEKGARVKDDKLAGEGIGRDELAAKARATNTSRMDPAKEPLRGEVREKFVVRGKGEAVLIVGEKKHTVMLTKGNEDKLQPGKHVALSPDGKGGVKVEPAKAAEKAVAGQNKPAPTQLSERAQPARVVEEKQNGRMAASRVEAEVKLKAPAPSAIDRAKAGEDGEPPAMDQRPTMKEWIAAQKDRGVDANAPIKQDVIRGKVEREPVYLKEGKHYVISENNGLKKTLESSPKLEEHRGKETRFVRNERGDKATTLEKSRGLSR